MCGIAGAFDLTGARDFPTDRLLAMTGAIAHRGPDDEQVHREAGVALGARRLSIIDLAGGRQPIPNEDGSIWVAFNGELFEYPELRQELLSRGHRLATRCDTEAWVHLYEDLGDEFVSRLRGMFVIALNDARRRRFILARDRVGKKPLFYAEVDGQWVFASELQALLRHPALLREVDWAALDDYLTYGYVPAPKTIFRGVHKLPPAHWLTVRLHPLPLIVIVRHILFGLSSAKYE